MIKVPTTALSAHARMAQAGPPPRRTPAEQAEELEALRREGDFFWQFFTVDSRAQKDALLRYTLDHLKQLTAEKGVGAEQMDETFHKVWEWAISCDDMVAKDFLWFACMYCCWFIYDYLMGTTAPSGGSAAPPSANASWLDYFLRTQLPTSCENFLSGVYGSSTYPMDDKVSAFTRDLRAELFSWVGTRELPPEQIRNRLFHSTYFPAQQQPQEKKGGGGKGTLAKARTHT